MACTILKSNDKSGIAKFTSKFRVGKNESEGIPVANDASLPLKLARLEIWRPIIIESERSEV
ncbi:hypothetical protein ACTXT7_002862 [Hymenolepis weldensis]